MAQDPGLVLALWRYQVIGPLLSVAGGRGSLRREIRRLAGQFHEHPLRGPIQLGYGTIEDWLYLLAIIKNRTFLIARRWERS